MRKQTCLYLQTGLLSRILHLLKRGLADRSSLFILIQLHELLLSVYNHTLPLGSVFSRPWKRKKVIFDISLRKKQR